MRLPNPLHGMVLSAIVRPTAANSARPTTTPQPDALFVQYPLSVDPEYTDRFLHTVRASATPKGALHTASEAVIRGDFDAFCASLPDDVELHICGFGPMDGA